MLISVLDLNECSMCLCVVVYTVMISKLSNVCFRF
jgi:hypothetical protein